MTEPGPSLGEGRVPPVPEDRESLRRCPPVELAPGDRVWRSHKRGVGPWYFGDGGRLGLKRPAGTCYVATDPLASICETVIRGRVQLEPADLADRMIRELPVPKEFVLADTPSAVHLGLGRSFSTEYPYDTCRDWAVAFYGVGFRGIAYWPSHDPRRGDLLSYALFDAAGERSSWRVGRNAEPLDSPHWRQRILDELRIRTIEPPDDSELEFANDI